jgi:hypothetical protein
MDRKHSTRLFFPLFVAALGFGGFLRMTGSENVRAVQIVILLACGMCLGVTLANFAALLTHKSQ